MADDYRRIDLITGEARRRHWSTEQKLQIIEESFLPGETTWRRAKSDLSLASSVDGRRSGGGGI